MLARFVFLLFAALIFSSFCITLNGFVYRGKNIKISLPLLIAIESKPELVSDGKIDLLYDSECPICALEVEFLKKRDIHNKITFTDLSSPDYNAADHGNVLFADGMRKLRAVMPDKTVITGVEVFRQTYNAIGLGWVFQFTNIPVIGKAADVLYDLWAENRLRITGRADLADKLKKQAEVLQSIDPADCQSDACELNWDD